MSLVFQSTRPVWGATKEPFTVSSRGIISIHAPRVGRDGYQRPMPRHRGHFNPRAPCGARRIPSPCKNSQRNFNPRAPCGARRRRHHQRQREDQFQSTRPVWGATSIVFSFALMSSNFNPRAPCGARRHCPRTNQRDCRISIHAPRVGRDSKFDDFTPSNLHKRYKRVLARPKNTREKGKIKQKLAYIHAFSAFLGCEGSGTFCALVLRTQYR